MLFKYIKLWISLFLMAGALGVLSCSHTSLGSKVPDLAQADSIQINNSWSGLALETKRHYSLQGQDKAFTGKAEFSVRSHSGEQPRQTTEDIQVPLDAAQSFLRTLASLPLREGEYKPSRPNTDDYPSIDITLVVKGETVVIFSRSQGKDHSPWGVKIKGKTFVAKSDLPARALQGLAPYLKHDELQKLIEQR